MIDHETSCVSYRFRSNRRFTMMFSPWTDNHQISLPCGCQIYNLALWPSLSLQRFRFPESTEALVQNILSIHLLSFFHFIPSRLTRTSPPHKSFPLSPALFPRP